jgi:hypothetical protein
MSQPPNRPFESLDWYREAARRGFAEDDRDRRLVTFLTGGDLLRLHISVFAVTIVALAVINLLRSPESIWVDRVFMVWALLLVIHGIGVGAIWAVRQWNAEDPDEPVQLSPSQWQQAPMFGWGAPGATPTQAQEAQFRVAPPPDAPTTPSPWADWANVTEAKETPESERASWSEATVTSWLQRRSQAAAPAEDKDQPAS